MSVASGWLHAALAILLPLTPSVCRGTSANLSGPPAAAAYQDRIIAPEDLAPLPDEGEDTLFDASGLPRSWRVELLAGRTVQGSRHGGETGIGIAGQWETTDWGSLSLDATVFDRTGLPGRGAGRSGAATLWQHGLHFDGGWRVDNGLGVLDALIPPLQRDQYRFFLPGTPLAGVGSRWRNAGAGLLLMASLGRAGAFSGSRLAAFEQAEGNARAFGAQWQWAPGWIGATSMLSTDGSAPAWAAQPGREATRALLASMGWSGARDRVRAHLQSSRSAAGDATGAWMDAESRHGRYIWNYGLFRLEDGLAWGTMPGSQDARGAYGRVQYQHARWNWSAGLDDIAPVGGHGFRGQYANFFLRYQAYADLAFGAAWNIRRSARSRDFSTRWFVDRRTHWGLSRLQLDLAGIGGEQEDRLLTLDQQLPLRHGTHLSLSAALGSQRREGVGRSRHYSLAALGGIDLHDRLSLNGHVRWFRGNGAEGFPGSDINLGLDWRFAPHWSLRASVYRHGGEPPSPFQLDPLAPPPPPALAAQTRAVFLDLSYQRQAGTPTATLGGSPGTAAGSIRGSVFLDENGDGVRSAAERPAANVTVLLDGRYALRTDSRGEFEFPRVAVGGHAIEVVPDNLPLPWFLDDDSRRQVEVRVRAATHVDFGARRGH